MHVLYILKSKTDDKLYIGTTSDLRKRLKEHSVGQSQATKSRRPCELVYSGAYRSKLDALDRERKLKHYKNSYTEFKKRIWRILEGA